MSSTRLRRFIGGLLPVLLTLPASAAGQTADPKAGFVDALAQFSVAVEGARGDEGPRIAASLDAMDRGLRLWNDTIAAYERAMAEETRRGDSKLAALAHIGLGGAYFDRGRVADALQQFTRAAALDPARVDVLILQGLASARLPKPDAAAAVAALRKAAALDPEDLAVAYLLARQLARTDRPEEAQKAWGQVVEVGKRRAAERTVTTATPFMRFGLVDEKSGVEPFLPPALYAEGFALLARGEYAGAVASLRASSERDPLVADQGNRYGMKRAADAFRDAAIDTAIEQLDAAIEIGPERAEPHRILGLVYAADDQYDRSAQELRTAIRLKPDDERARLALADALVNDGKLPEAETALRETIAAFPRSGRAHYVLGRLYQRQGKQPEAVRELKASLDFGPLLGANGIYQAIGAMSAARQDFDAAVAAYSNRVDVHPNDAKAHQDLGETYSRLGRTGEALAEFVVVLLLDPEHAGAHAASAQIYLREGQYAEAIDAARRALDADATRVEARYTLATALLRLGRTEEGQKELEAYQRMQAQTAAANARALELGALRREGSAASAAGDYEKAVTLFRRALALEPDLSVSHLNLGMALQLAGHSAEAVTEYLAAVALGAPPEVHQRLAELYAALGKADESRRELELFVRLKQDNLRRAGAER